MTNPELKPCPFCKVKPTIGKNLVIKPNQIWTGVRYQVNHYELTHWCKGTGIPSIVINMKAKTQEELFTLWNEGM